MRILRVACETAAGLVLLFFGRHMRALAPWLYEQHAKSFRRGGFAHAISTGSIRSIS